MMVTNLKNYLTLDNDDDDADFRYKYRDNMIGQFKQALYHKNFNHQDKDKRDDGIRKKLSFGSIMLLEWDDQYQIMFMIMIKMIME